jgi:hypothetical protein
VWNALTVGVNGVGAGAAGQEQRGGCLVEEERADAELEEQQRARGRGGGGGGGGEEGVPGGRGREVLRERRVRGVVAQPRAPRAAGLQQPRELVAAPVLAQQLRRGRRHPRGGPRLAGISIVSDTGGRGDEPRTTKKVEVATVLAQQAEQPYSRRRSMRLRSKLVYQINAIVLFVRSE